MLYLLFRNALQLKAATAAAAATATAAAIVASLANVSVQLRLDGDVAKWKSGKVSQGITNH